MQVAQALGLRLGGLKAPCKRKATPAEAAKPVQAMAPPPAQASSAQQTPGSQQAAMPIGKKQRQTLPRQTPGMFISYNANIGSAHCSRSYALERLLNTLRSQQGQACLLAGHKLNIGSNG